MLEHHMDIDPSYQKLQENLNGMQKIQIEQEVVANEEKEQKIQERQPKTAEELQEDLNQAVLDNTQSFQQVQNNEKEKQKNIETAQQDKELNPQEKQELAENTIKNINENERFKEYYGLEDDLTANQKAQEELDKKHQKEMDELDKQYGQGQYYKPNWTFGDDTKQTKQENSKEEQEDPYKLSQEEEARRKEYLKKRT